MTQSALNDAVFEKLASADPHEAVDAISLWTRERMWTLTHIPFEYYLPDSSGRTTPQLEQLYSELATHGKIVLDRAGKPCCLTGRRPALLHIYPDLHGPWKEEPCDSSNATN